MEKNNTKYNEVYNSLLTLISTGEWKIGDKIPSENNLKNHYNVSRLTIRKALEILSQENTILKNKGKKSIVLSRRVANTKIFLNTSLEKPDTKKNRKSRLINFIIKKLKDKENKNFNNEPAFEIIRFFYDAELPAFIATGRVPKGTVPNLNEKIFSIQKFSNASLSEILRAKYELKIYKQKITVSAITLTDNESNFFKVPKNYPAIKFISHFYDKQNHILFTDKEISLKEIYLENIYSI